MGETCDDDNSQRLGRIIAEDIECEFRAGFETLEGIKRQADKISGIEIDIVELKDDMKTVKAVLKVTNKAVQNHEKRITKLETTVYG